MLINAAAFVVVVAGLQAASSIAVMLLVAAFFAIISAPAVLWLKEKKVPSALAVLLVVGAVIVILSTMGVLLGASINGFVQAMPAYRARLDDSFSGIVQWMREAGLAEYGLDQLRSVNAGAVMGVVGNVFTALGGLLGNSFIILLTVLFILFEASSFPVKLRAAFSGSEAPVDRFREIAGNVVHYLALKTLVSLITGVAAGMWVWIVGLDFPLLWGLLAFLLNYIPTFGSLVSAIPPIVLSLILLGPGSAGLVALGYLVVNLVMGNVVEPKLMGQGLGLSTLVVFLSLLAWGWVLGTAGMFLAVPLTVALRIVLESSEETRWIAILMGPGKEAAKAEKAAG
ncbi:MAG: AI-2E family transporter [bacterium]|nr:AI-2E family transporter [bacterium]